MSYAGADHNLAGPPFNFNLSEDWTWVTPPQEAMNVDAGGARAASQPDEARSQVSTSHTAASSASDPSHDTAREPASSVDATAGLASVSLADLADASSTCDGGEAGSQGSTLHAPAVQPQLALEGGGAVAASQPDEARSQVSTSHTAASSASDPLHDTACEPALSVDATAGLASVSLAGLADASSMCAGGEAALQQGAAPSSASDRSHMPAVSVSNGIVCEPASCSKADEMDIDITDGRGRIDPRYACCKRNFGLDGCKTSWKCDQCWKYFHDSCVAKPKLKMGRQDRICNSCTSEAQAEQAYTDALDVKGIRHSKRTKR
uniref:Uncharacterized protein n=2 Tax=Haptolina brevifila TaxID=156173 RepID=A0A7S2JHK7_9EUKA|mmetsp:Transcript_82685/g.164999  ORF Transcript_82685/g.164999 Transcript_82685/m.164999 type:complete len:320 (+) Transcript_82685:1162-2121(+)